VIEVSEGSWSAPTTSPSPTIPPSPAGSWPTSNARNAPTARAPPTGPGSAPL